MVWSLRLKTPSLENLGHCFPCVRGMRLKQAFIGGTGVLECPKTKPGMTSLRHHKIASRFYQTRIKLRGALDQRSAIPRAVRRAGGGGKGRNAVENIKVHSHQLACQRHATTLD